MLQWSDEARSLYDRAQELGKTTFSAVWLEGFFETLRLRDMDITEIDEGLLRFSKLRELSLTGNFIAELHHIPAAVSVLHVCGNRCVSVQGRTACHALKGALALTAQVTGGALVP